MNRNYPHFAIPEIYGESLSYYEVLRKLVNAMNVMIDNYNTIPDQIAEEVKNLDAAQLFSTVLNQLVHSIATDNTKSTNAVKVYKKHDLLYATFNDTVNLYESLLDFTTGAETELIVGSNIREVNISELFIELRKLIDINKNNIKAVTSLANENRTEIATIHNDITDIENKNTEQDNELRTLRTMISSPYNFKGDVASISALPANGEVNDTYYVQDVKYKVTWTGSAWVQSSLNEADYQTELSELKDDLSAIKGTQIFDRNALHNGYFDIQSGANPAYVYTEEIDVTNSYGKTIYFSANGAPVNARMVAVKGKTAYQVGWLKQNVSSYTVNGEGNNETRIRITFPVEYKDTFQAEYGGVTPFNESVKYIRDDSINGLRELKANMRNKKYYVDVETTAHDYYMTTTGSTATSDYYSSVEFSPISGEKYLIHSSSGGLIPNDLSYITMINSSGEVVGFRQTTLDYYGEFESNVNKVVVSYRSNLAPLILIESENPNKLPILKDVAVSTTSHQKLTNNFDCIKKNTLINVIAYPSDSDFQIRISRGSGYYFNYYIDVTKTSLNINGTETISHGLNISSYVAITIDTDRESNTKITLVSENGTFTHDCDFYADGEIQLIGDKYTIASASITHKDYNKKVWFYGDSYSGTRSSDRWCKKAMDSGCDFMVNGLSGGNSLQLLDSFMNDVSYGKPEIVMWGLGMNDASDNGEPDSVWKAVFNRVKEICQLLDIRFVGCTIPSVPGKNNAYKTIYCRANCDKYVDFANAVYNGQNSNWKTGMLSLDNVHPTELGAIALCTEAVTTVTELFN